MNNVINNKKENAKFHFVSFLSSDNKKYKELFIGETPEKSLKNAKENRIAYKSFKVGKTAYNTYGEKYK